MRIGPALWSRFTDAINPDDFNLKHHIYSELASLDVDEFNMKMREIMAGTSDGKEIVAELVKEIKADLDEDDFNLAMTEIDGVGEVSEESNGNTFDLGELMGGSSEDKSEGFNLEELL
jgi:hypothetical protein